MAKIKNCQKEYKLKSFSVVAISIPRPSADSGASLNSESHTPQPLPHQRKVHKIQKYLPSFPKNILIAPLFHYWFNQPAQQLIFVIRVSSNITVLGKVHQGYQVGNVEIMIRVMEQSNTMSLSLKRNINGKFLLMKFDIKSFNTYNHIQRLSEPGTFEIFF